MEKLPERVPGILALVLLAVVIWAVWLNLTEPQAIAVEEDPHSDSPICSDVKDLRDARVYECETWKGTVCLVVVSKSREGVAVSCK